MTSTKNIFNFIPSKFHLRHSYSMLLNNSHKLRKGNKILQQKLNLSRGKLKEFKPHVILDALVQALEDSSWSPIDVSFHQSE